MEGVWCLWERLEQNFGTGFLTSGSNSAGQSTIKWTCCKLHACTFSLPREEEILWRNSQKHASNTSWNWRRKADASGIGEKIELCLLRFRWHCGKEYWHTKGPIPKSLILLLCTRGLFLLSINAYSAFIITRRFGDLYSELLLMWLGSSSPIMRRKPAT